MNPQERSRNIESTILQAIQGQGRQVALAAAIGVHESTVSKLKGDALSQFALLLAHALGKQGGGQMITPIHWMIFITCVAAVMLVITFIEPDT